MCRPIWSLSLPSMSPSFLLVNLLRRTSSQSRRLRNLHLVNLHRRTSSLLRHMRILRLVNQHRRTSSQSRLMRLLSLLPTPLRNSFRTRFALSSGLTPLAMYILQLQEISSQQLISQGFKPPYAVRLMVNPTLMAAANNYGVSKSPYAIKGNSTTTTTCLFVLHLWELCNFVTL